MLEMLPNLRRVFWQHSDAEDYAALAGALAKTKIEALYISIDSAGIYHDAFDAFAQVETLKELVVVCDSCELLWNDDGIETFRETPSYAEVTRRLCDVLGRSAVLICDCCSLERADLDPLHRIFLPTSEEEWHLEPDACGHEHLTFLSSSESAEMQGRIHTMNEIWHGRRERPDPGSSASPSARAIKTSGCLMRDGQTPESLIEAVIASMRANGELPPEPEVIAAPSVSQQTGRRKVWQQQEAVAMEVATGPRRGMHAGDVGYEEIFCCCRTKGCRGESDLAQRPRCRLSVIVGRASP